MILVDSCGWIEYFTDGPLADKYYNYLKNPGDVIVPATVIYEVYKKIKKENNEDQAILAIGQMSSSRIVPLSESIALLAADVSLEYKLPMADSIVYATAKIEDAVLVSSDKHFKDLDSVKFIKQR